VLHLPIVSSIQSIKARLDRFPVDTLLSVKRVNGLIGLRENEQMMDQQELLNFLGRLSDFGIN
jgi:hypothetical protein